MLTGGLSAGAGRVRRAGGLRRRGMDELKPCPFCGGDVRFDEAYSYFRDSVIYCDGCDMVFTLDDCTASDDDIARAWNRRCRKNG